LTGERFGDVSLRIVDDTPLIAVAADVDISNVDDLRHALEAAPHADRVVLDMTGVGFLDSTALAAIVRYRNAVAARGTIVTLVIDSPLVRRIFSLTNFDRQFTIVARLGDVPGLEPEGT
jgi:anti-sigma B factor antagonist